VSHFVKAALDNIVSTALQGVPNGTQSEEMRKLLKTGNYAHIAMKLGLRVIHISEIDTQTTTMYVHAEALFVLKGSFSDPFLQA
jgi:homospermidine synthase